MADGIIAALGSDGFEHYVPDMKAVVDAKNADIDAYIAGAAGMAPAMKALVFGVPPEPFEVPDDANTLTRTWRTRPSALRDVPDPQPLHDDWVITRPRLTGICGSDSKQILLDFGEGDTDNAMAAFCSFPQVMGHEVVADVVALGPKARGLEIGQRVVLNPWLSCGPRGIEPPCPACETGDYSLCWSFTDGDIKPGIHTGVSERAEEGDGGRGGHLQPFPPLILVLRLRLRMALVPVIRQEDRCPLRDMVPRYDELIELARQRKLPTDATGGSIATVTNFGSFGLTWATPIPLPEQTLVLGMGSARRVPHWDEARAEFIPIMEANVTLSFDHRVLDGGAAGRLLARVAQLLAQPEKL